MAEIHERREIDDEMRCKVDALERLKEVVCDLQCRKEGLDDDDDGQRKEEKKKKGAVRVRSSSKEDEEARSLLAMLGAIPPLVGMIDCDDDESKINALNKATIVKASAVHKMLKLIESSSGDNVATNPMISEAIVANFLALSASDSNKLIIGSSGAIPFLVNTLMNLDQKSSAQFKQDALRALYNFSIPPSYIGWIIETNFIAFLITSLGVMDVSDRSFSILFAREYLVPKPKA